MRTIARFIVGVLAMIGLGSVVAAAYLLPISGFFSADAPGEEPNVTFVRLTDREVQQEVLFSTPCDPGGLHLYLGDGNDVRLPLRPRWPGDLPDLEDSDYAAPGNRFLLEGYPVMQTTGETLTPLLYFDVTAWSPIPPYRIWREEGGSFSEEVDVTDPVTFRSTLADPTFETASYVAGGGC